MSSDPASTEQEQVSENFFAHLPAIIWQRRMLLIVPLILCFLAGIAASLLMPATYRSSALLLVESQQLPKELVGSPLTNVIDQRIAKIRQQILSRPDLIELILANNLYPSDRSSKPLSQIVEKMRDATTITPVSADMDNGPSNNRNETNTIAFTLSFDYSDPAKAQIIAQEFVDRFLKLDSTKMAEQATSTVNFLQVQADTLQDGIAKIERQIESIKGANGITLSNANMMMMGNNATGVDAQIAALQRENSQLQIQARTVSGGNRDPGVVAAESQLAAVRAIYSDNHPDVRLAEQRLAEARALATKNGAQTSTNEYAAQIASNNSVIASLNAARAQEQSRASAVMSAQSRAPLVMEQIAQLQSEAEGLRNNYQKVSASLLAAQNSSRMETEQRGERLSVVDPPVVPDKPSSPNRPLLVIAGLLVGGAIGLGLVLGLEFLLRPIRDVAALQNLLGVPPMVVVPTMHEVERPHRLRRLLAWRPRLPWRRKKAAQAL